jgi:hypothetical protein
MKLMTSLLVAFVCVGMVASQSKRRGIKIKSESASVELGTSGDVKIQRENGALAVKAKSVSINGAFIQAKAYKVGNIMLDDYIEKTIRTRIKPHIKACEDGWTGHFCDERCTKDKCPTTTTKKPTTKKPTTKKPVPPKPTVSCGEGSDKKCKVTVLPVKGYSPGMLVKVENGIKVRRSTEKHSCPKGFKIWSPRSKKDWTLVYNAMKKKIENYPRKPHLIVDVTRPKNGCGGCTKYAMNSKVSQQGEWKTTDGSDWWLRDGKYNEPNGDYHANCYLHIYDVNPNNVRFNDGNCGHVSSAYLCQPAKKRCGGPPVNWQTAKDSTAPPGWKVSGFSGNVGNQRQCAGGWNAYRGGSGQGTLSTTLKGSGTLTAKYRDCWREGHATMYLNGKQVGQSGNRNGALKTTSVTFKNGDTLSFKDTGTNGVLHIVSITYKC